MKPQATEQHLAGSVLSSDEQRQSCAEPDNLESEIVLGRLEQGGYENPESAIVGRQDGPAADLWCHRFTITLANESSVSGLSLHGRSHGLAELPAQACRGETQAHVKQSVEETEQPAST